MTVQGPSRGEGDGTFVVQPVDLTVEYIAADAMTGAMRADKHALQVACFADVPAEEIFDYFVADPIGSVLAWIAGEMVGCVSVFKRTITFKGRPVTLGGYGGTCTRVDLRGQGIGSRLCRVAMDSLHAEGCDIAMLAVDKDGSTTRFYERQGYRPLGRPFEIITAKGQRVTPDDIAMVAPVGSGDILHDVLAGTEPLFLGPEPDYW